MYWSDDLDGYFDNAFATDESMAEARTSNCHSGDGHV